MTPQRGGSSNGSRCVKGSTAYRILMRKQSRGGAKGGVKKNALRWAEIAYNSEFAR